VLEQSGQAPPLGLITTQAGMDSAKTSGRPLSQ
jgi:hypothetical protein